MRTPPPNLIDGILGQIRQEWLDFLEAIPYFTDLTIVVEDKDDIQNEHERALGPGLVGDTGKQGIFIILLTVAMDVYETDGHGVIAGDVKLLARVYENVPVNRAPSGKGTGKPYGEVAEQLATYTSGNCRPLSANSFITLCKPGIVLGNDPNWPCKDVYFTTTASISQKIPIPQAATPVIVMNEGVATITCATPGAAIFLTLDGTKPNPFDALYAGPFMPAPGNKMKARAWLAGYLKSELAIVQT